MNDTVSLERELERRASRGEGTGELWHRYEAMKAFLARDYYPWVQAACPHFTDHGRGHVESVIETASRLLGEQLRRKARGELSEVDLFLILGGIIWHDVGMAFGRSNHAQRASEMMEEVQRLGFPCPTMKRLASEIVRAHAGNSGLQLVKPEEKCSLSGKTYTVYPRALAAVLRFADEVSETRSRISAGVIGRVPTEQQVYWQYAQAIVGALPEPERERIVVAVELDRVAVLARFPCVDFPDYQDQDGKISLLEYVLCRLEKMNNERVYCSTSLAKYVSVREIEVRIAVVRDGERVRDYDNLTLVIGDCGLDHAAYPSIHLVKTFFEHHPAWGLDTLAEALQA
jgi:hypothetical protein